jgi:undecaprenyl-diphosphatase
MTLQSTDTSLLLFVNNAFANSLFDLLMPFLSAQGYLLVIPFLSYQVVAGALRKDDWGRRFAAVAVWTIVIAFAALFLADWTEYLVKNAVARIRPCRSVEGIRLIMACPNSFSMPSGHAISSFAFAFPLYYLTKNYLPLAARLFPLLLASAIAFSRVYLGVHYPTDVIVGAIFGVLIALALSRLYLDVWRIVEKRRREKGSMGS